MLRWWARHVAGTWWRLLLLFWAPVLLVLALAIMAHLAAGWIT